MTLIDEDLWVVSPLCSILGWKFIIFFFHLMFNDLYFFQEVFYFYKTF